VDLRRLRVGEWITALAGVVLLVSLFLPWYGEADAAAATELSGWESLALLDIVLSLIAAAAVALALITAVQPLPAVPLTWNTFVVFAGMLAVVLVLVRVIDLPDGAGARDWGLWLGLAGALGILAGALIALRDDRHVSPARYTDLSGRPAPPPREPEAIPAPRPDLQSPR
jgi:hypothetical protein